MNEQITNEPIIDIKKIVNAILKRWQIIVICVFVCTILATIVSFFILKPKYQSSTKLFIGKEASSEEGYSNSDIQMYQNLLKSYASVIKTNDLVTRAVKNLPDIEESTESILGNLEVITTNNTQIMEIKCTSYNKKSAMLIVSSITDEFISTSESLIKNANIKIIEEAKLPISSISPNKKINILLGFMVGIILGLGIIFVIEYLDTTIKNKEEAEEYLKLPVIGDIPKENNFK